MEKLIITAAICGAEVTKEHNPAVPYTVEEMVREAKGAYEAGAAVIHVHVRTDDGTPTQDRERFRVVMDAIKAIRARRAEMNVAPSKKAEVLLVTATPEIYRQGLHFMERLAYASAVTFADAAPADVSGLVTVVTHNATAYLPLSELVDLAAERERIAKEIEKAKNGLRIVEQKLSNEKFVSKAPEAVVNVEREKAAKYKELIAKLEESAKAMEG